MYSGQEAFGCCTEWLYLRPAAATHPSPQVQSLKGADGHQHSACKPTTSTERLWILLWRMPNSAFRPHGCHADSYKSMKYEGTKFW